jgi:diguanylate cyclase (GGDEF)-like protein
MLKPEAFIIDKIDYLGRIGVLCIVIRIAFYVNKIYIKRLSQNADQLSLQRFISEISSDFINVDQSNIDEKINWVIKIVGKLFSIDQINKLLIDLEHQTIEYTTIWDAEENGARENYKHNIQFDDISWLMNQLISRESIYIPNVDLLPDAAARMKNEFKKRKICSVVAIPIQERGKTIGILEFTSGNSTKIFQDDEMRVLKIIANIFDDALTKVEAENEIKYMAYHDHLTCLPNRRLFKDRLNQAIALAKRTEKLIGVIFIDLDSFKNINDTLGHEGGDFLLKIVSEKLVNTVRNSDTVSRYGGDEFIIMVNNISSEGDIIHIMEKIMLTLGQPIIVDGQVFNLTTSAGISTYPFDGTDSDSLLRNADISMYKAKEKGKNQFVVCSSELKEEVIYKIKMTNSLYRALERDEFYLHYQPQIDLSTKEIIGLEALIRWKHPELGFVSPAVFIPIAEQTGLINVIGEWVLKNACEQNKKWQEAGYSPVRMAVNVSANQLRNPIFVEQIKNTLNETAMSPKFLEIEITESTVMNETEDIAKFLGEIRDLGVMISIDDFGTDYSSLSRLKELPIDKIKIDKQFVDGIEECEKDRAIVRTIINLANNLDLKVIAEGVENEKQLEFLKQELCDEVQGYHYYRPMSDQDIEKILFKNRILSH